MRTVIKERQAGLTERRLTGRILKTWRACTDDRLPSWADMLSLDLGEDWKSCFAVDLSLSDGFPYFIYLGDNLCRLANIYLTGRGPWETSLIDLAASKMDEAALSREPVSTSDTLRLPNGRRVVFRSVLLPLSENSKDISHVFGAVNGKGV